jgi:hypothetical protein
MEGGGIKLALMLAIGLLLIEVGITGKPGSLLGAIIDPGSMVEQASRISTTSGPASSSNVPLASNVSSGTITSQVQQVFGPYAGQALQIINAESSMNPNAYNSISVGGSHAEGLFQILYPSTWNTTSQAANNPYNATANIKAAYEIFQRDGFSWREWATATSLGLS